MLGQEKGVTRFDQGFTLHSPDRTCVVCAVCKHSVGKGGTDDASSDTILWAKTMLEEVVEERGVCLSTLNSRPALPHGPGQEQM